MKTVAAILFIFGYFGITWRISYLPSVIVNLSLLSGAVLFYISQGEVTVREYGNARVTLLGALVTIMMVVSFIGGLFSGWLKPELGIIYLPMALLCTITLAASIACSFLMIGFPVKR